MKITKSYLKQIIKEEYARVLKEYSGDLGDPNLYGRDPLTPVKSVSVTRFSIDSIEKQANGYKVVFIVTVQINDKLFSNEYLTCDLSSDLNLTKADLSSDSIRNYFDLDSRYVTANWYRLVENAAKTFVNYDKVKKVIQEKLPEAKPMRAGFDGNHGTTPGNITHGGTGRVNPAHRELGSLQNSPYAAGKVNFRTDTSKAR